MPKKGKASTLAEKTAFLKANVPMQIFVYFTWNLGEGLVWILKEKRKRWNPFAAPVASVSKDFMLILLKDGYYGPFYDILEDRPPKTWVENLKNKMRTAFTVDTFIDFDDHGVN